jgi:hypothetical protein
MKSTEREHSVTPEIRIVLATDNVTGFKIPIFVERSISS